VRQAAVADAKALIHILTVVGNEGIYIANEGPSWSIVTQAEILRRAAAQGQCILVAEHEGHVVGSLELVRGTLAKNRHTANLAMALLPEWRGRGGGGALLAAAHAYAETHGIRKICLSVFATNHAALGLYQRFGYTEEGRRKAQFVVGGRLVDEVLMAKFFTG
jgi:RimJ/RimL family protein N-acetyltransferase